LNKEVYATNLFKYYYTQKPSSNLLRRHSELNVKLLKEELKALPDCPILTLGEPILQLLTSDKEKVKDYWEDNHANFVAINGVTQKIYPFIHYNTWNTKKMYKERFEKQLDSIGLN
jgi:uracil-DNA glycosylase